MTNEEVTAIAKSCGINRKCQNCNQCSHLHQGEVTLYTCNITGNDVGWKDLCDNWEPSQNLHNALRTDNTAVVRVINAPAPCNKMQKPYYVDIQEAEAKIRDLRQQHYEEEVDYYYWQNIQEKETERSKKISHAAKIKKHHNNMKSLKEDIDQWEAKKKQAQEMFDRWANWEPGMRTDRMPPLRGLTMQEYVDLTYNIDDVQHFLSAGISVVDLTTAKGRVELRIKKELDRARQLHKKYCPVSSDGKAKQRKTLAEVRAYFDAKRKGAVV